MILKCKIIIEYIKNLSKIQLILQNKKNDIAQNNNKKLQIKKK